MSTLLSRNLLSGKTFAKMLDVTPPALSQAVRREHYCAEVPVFKYAVQAPSGRTKGYDVPAKVRSELMQRRAGSAASENGAAAEESAGTWFNSSAEEESAEEEAPSRQVAKVHAMRPKGHEEAQRSSETPRGAERAERRRNASETRHEASEALQRTQQAAGTPQNAVGTPEDKMVKGGPAGDRSVIEAPLYGYEGTSLLPPGENYSRPAALLSSALVLKSALEERSHLAQGVGVTVAGLLSALGTSELSGDSRWAALLAAVAGSGTTAWGVGLFDGQPAEERGAAEQPHAGARPQKTPASPQESGQDEPLKGPSGPDAANLLGAAPVSQTVVRSLEAGPSATSVWNDPPPENDGS